MVFEQLKQVPTWNWSDLNGKSVRVMVMAGDQNEKHPRDLIFLIHQDKAYMIDGLQKNKCSHSTLKMRPSPSDPFICAYCNEVLKY